MPSARINKIHCQNYRSEIEVTIELISGKWVVLLLTLLQEQEVVRFNEFRKYLPELTQKVLSQQLKKLEENRIITKQIHQQIPPKVEYRLSEYGEGLLPILAQMQAWGRQYIQSYPSETP